MICSKEVVAKAMIAAKNSIFRDKALKHYAQSKKKDVLPNFGSVPAMIFFWIMLILLTATCFMAWYIKIPIYASGLGLVLGPEIRVQEGSASALAVGFFAPNSVTQLQAGQAVQVQLGGQKFTSTIV